MYFYFRRHAYPNSTQGSVHWVPAANRRSVFAQGYGELMAWTLSAVCRLPTPTHRLVLCTRPEVILQTRLWKVSGGICLANSTYLCVSLLWNCLYDFRYRCSLKSVIVSMTIVLQRGLPFLWPILHFVLQRPETKACFINNYLSRTMY